jgi:hypothetical protein
VNTEVDLISLKNQCCDLLHAMDTADRQIDCQDQQQYMVACESNILRTELFRRLTKVCGSAVEGSAIAGHLVSSEGFVESFKRTTESH